MGKKSDSAEIERRANKNDKHLPTAKTSSDIRRFANEEWGVSESQADRYLARARDIIRADYSVDRSDFLGSRLALLDEIIEASISTKQHSNAVGALKLQAQLTRLLEGNS